MANYIFTKKQSGNVWVQKAEGGFLTVIPDSATWGMNIDGVTYEVSYGGEIVLAFILGDVDSIQYEPSPVLIVPANATELDDNMDLLFNDANGIGKTDLIIYPTSQNPNKTLVVPYIDTAVDNWSPSGFENADIIMVASYLAADVTGLQAPALDGTTISIHNIGIYNITLKVEDASSDESNRFHCSDITDVVIYQQHTATLTYSKILNRWLVK